jgi:hypothetical protein
LAFCGADRAGLGHIHGRSQVILDDPTDSHQGGGQFYVSRRAAYDQILP